MIHRLIAYSLILLGIVGTIYMGFEGIYGDRYDTPSLGLASLNRQVQDSIPLLLIDVRTPVEVASRPAPWDGVLNIPLLDLESRTHELAAYRGSSIVVLCPTGTRSAEGARVLRAAGYKAVFLQDGMFDRKEKAL
jgi:rhodanese-related sulfurtransferase